MWNIIKAQNYQTKGDNVVVYCFLFCFAFLLLLFFSEQNSLSDMTGSLYLVSVCEFIPIFLAVIALVLTTRICGWDFGDKTMNYELLAGHSRGEVYWARIITSMLWAVLGGVIFTVLPLLVFTVMNGWGSSMSLKGALMHLFLVLPPMFRLICEFALLTFLLKNCFVAMIIGWVLYNAVTIITLLLEEALNFQFSVQFASTNISRLLDFSNYSTGYIGGEDVTVYSTALEPSMAVATVAVSLLVGAACLVIGYIYFRKIDMN